MKDEDTDNSTKSGRRHDAIVTALSQYVGSEGLYFDAQGCIRNIKTNTLSKRSIPGLSRNFAYLERYNYPISVSYVVETLETIAERAAIARAEELKAAILERDSSAEGAAELRRWLLIVTGRTDETDYAVMRHWIWLVKRGLADMKPLHHIMPILQGKQGGGKSTAICKLLEPLAELAMIPATAAILTDERRAPALASYAVAVMDEMQGVQKADTEALKQTISAESKTYRPMRTTESQTIPIRCRFIGSTNDPVAGLINDTTGARRFYELACPPVLDWKAMDTIDPFKLWTVVSEREPCSFEPVMGEVRTRQASLRRMDNVSLWLEEESWEFPGHILYGASLDSGAPEKVRLKPGDWVPTRVLRELYVLWCRRVHCSELDPAPWGRRLHAEGLIPTKRKGDPQMGDRRVPGYLLVTDTGTVGQGSAG